MNNLIADYLDLTTICLHADAADWVSVLELLGRRLHASGAVRPSFVDALIAREWARPTGIRLGAGVNVGLPRTDPEHVIRPGLALATLVKPVSFGSMDHPGELLPVRLVLVTASTEQSAHLRTLQRVAGLFQGRTTVDNLLTAESVAFVAASICNGSDARVPAVQTGQLADDLWFLRSKSEGGKGSATLN